MLRELVDAGGRKAPPGSDGANQGGNGERGLKVVGVRVSQVGGDGIGSRRVPNILEARDDELESLLPGDLYEFSVDALHGCTKTVGIFTERAESCGLGADVALA